jgi:hypothetical protein
MKIYNQINFTITVSKGDFFLDLKNHWITKKYKIDITKNPDNSGTYRIILPYESKYPKELILDKNKKITGLSLNPKSVSFVLYNQLPVDILREYDLQDENSIQYDRFDSKFEIVGTPATSSNLVKNNLVNPILGITILTISLYYLLKK